MITCVPKQSHIYSARHHTHLIHDHFCAPYNRTPLRHAQSPTQSTITCVPKQSHIYSARPITHLMHDHFFTPYNRTPLRRAQSPTSMATPPKSQSISHLAVLPTYFTSGSRFLDLLGLILIWATMSHPGGCGGGTPCSLLQPWLGSHIRGCPTPAAAQQNHLWVAQATQRCHTDPYPVTPISHPRHTSPHPGHCVTSGPHYFTSGTTNSRLPFISS